MMDKIPERVVTHSMSEAIELHLAIARERGIIIKLSDRARKKLIQGLLGQEKQMKAYGHTKTAIQDSITCAIWAFVQGYEEGMA